MDIHNLLAFCKDGEHAIEYAKKNAEKARKKQIAAQKRESRKARLELRDNDYSHQIKLTQTEFNKLVRMLDEGQPCSCCGKNPENAEWDCGHVLSRGAHPELRFCFFNAMRQLASCNRGDVKYKGRQATVRQGMENSVVERFGQEVLDWLKGPHPVTKWSIDELKQMRAMYTAEQRYIKDHGKPSRDWRRFPPLEAVA